MSTPRQTLLSEFSGTLLERTEFQREAQWRQAGVPEADIKASVKTGMDARDIRVFREFSAKGLMFIVRCPKHTARSLHELFDPKIMAIKQKTGSSGVAVTPRGMFVSDYDMMSVWRRNGPNWDKIFISAENGRPRGRWTPEAGALVRDLNDRLVSKLQHGCQDDFHSADNPGVKVDQDFAAFADGALEVLGNRFLCSVFYARHGLEWPYDGNGKYTGPIASG